MNERNGATMNDTATDPETGEIFDLESPPAPGTVPPRVIDELRGAYRAAKDMAGALSEMLKAQAEKYRVKPAALRRYIAALEGDKIDEAAAEAADLESLIASGE